VLSAHDADRAFSQDLGSGNVISPPICMSCRMCTADTGQDDNFENPNRGARSVINEGKEKSGNF
jgi:hypothetical protein